MPLVANPRKATADLIGELLAEFARPLPHGFVADDGSVNCRPGMRSGARRGMVGGAVAAVTLIEAFVRPCL